MLLIWIVWSARLKVKGGIVNLSSRYRSVVNDGSFVRSDHTSITELAQELKISPQAIRIRIKRGLIPEAFRYGGRWYVTNAVAEVIIMNHRYRRSSKWGLGAPPSHEVGPGAVRTRGWTWRGKRREGK